MNIPIRYNLSTICLTDIRSALTLLLPLMETSSKTGPNWFQLVLTGSSELQFPHFTKTFHRTIHNKFSLFTIGFYYLQNLSCCLHCCDSLQWKLYTQFPNSRTVHWWSSICFSTDPEILTRLIKNSFGRSQKTLG